MNDIKHRVSLIFRDSWSPEEDAKIETMVNDIGMKWDVIADSLPGRTIMSVMKRCSFILPDVYVAGDNEDPVCLLQSKVGIPDGTTSPGTAPVAHSTQLETREAKIRQACPETTASSSNVAQFTEVEDKILRAIITTLLKGRNIHHAKRLLGLLNKPQQDTLLKLNLVVEEFESSDEQRVWIGKVLKQLSSS